MAKMKLELPIKSIHKPVKEFMCFNCQVEKLCSRNLVCSKKEDLKKFLMQVNYYRFTGYLIDFKDPSAPDAYYFNTNFKGIKDFYQADSELRLILTSLLEWVEITLRTGIAYTLSYIHGPLGYLDPDTFVKRSSFNKFNEYVLPERILRSENKEYVSHHFKFYGGCLPIWVVTEILTFDNLCNLYINMQDKDIMFMFKNVLVVNPTLLKRWIFKLNHLRNECAHFQIVMRVKRRPITIPKKYWKFNLDKTSIFSYCLCMIYIVNNAEITSKFIKNISEFLKAHSMSSDDIDFPENWIDILRF